MVNTVLPFPAASGVNTPPRPPSPTAASRDDFAGAMDDALDARATRRADSTSRAAARRPDPARPRDAAEKDAAGPARKASSATPAAKTGRAASADDDISVEREAEASSDDVVVADPSDATPAEAKTADDTTAQSGDQAADDGIVDELAATAVNCDPALLGEGEGDADAADGDDSLARGRRWATQAAQANEDGETAANGGAHRAGGAAGSGLKLGHAIQQARAEANAAPGAALAQVAQDVVAAAHAEATAAEVATNEPVTEAVETAVAKPQTASAAAAATAIETAASALETVAAVEASAQAGTGESETQDQTQHKPQTAGAPGTHAATVAVSGPEGGVKFTVNSAAGNAAYTNAAPRGEEAVLPQIVQSIRLHAVQGTTEARVQLKPEHLGTLNITLKVEQNQVTATIQADVAAVRQWIESHEASLRQSLSEQGLQLARLVVHPDGDQPSKDAPDGERPRRQPRRRSWRDDEQTFEVLV